MPFAYLLGRTSVQVLYHSPFDITYFTPTELPCAKGEGSEREREGLGCGGCSLRDGSRRKPPPPLTHVQPRQQDIEQEGPWSHTGATSLLGRQGCSSASSLGPTVVLKHRTESWVGPTRKREQQNHRDTQHSHTDPILWTHVGTQHNHTDPTLWTHSTAMLT